MSAKAKPAHQIRHRARAATTGENGSGKGAFSPATPSHVCKQDAERKQIECFDCADLLPPAKLDQARTWRANAEPAERQPG